MSAALSEVTILEIEEALTEERPCEVLSVSCDQPAIWWKLLGGCCQAVVAVCAKHKYGLTVEEEEARPGPPVDWGNGQYDDARCGAIGAKTADLRWADSVAAGNT